MRFFWIRATLIALYSISFTVQIHGELVMIRHPPIRRNGMVFQDVTCKSEDDGSALVWNKNLEGSKSETPFKATLAINGHWISESNNSWEFSGTNWKRTNSDQNAMGPIYDYRWEELEKDEILGVKVVIFETEKPRTVVFSVRGLEDAKINATYRQKPEFACFTMTIESEHIAFKNHSCNDGESPIEKISMNSAKELRFNRSFANVLEWRTFVLKWNGTSIQTIPTETIDENFDRQGLQPLGSEVPYRRQIRRHFYKYFLSEKNGTSINLTGINYKEKMLHVELIHSLCPVCQLAVFVFDKNGTELERGHIDGVKNEIPNNLRLWQIDQLKMNLKTKDYESPIKITMFAKLNGSISNEKTWWAVGGARIYKPQGDTRESKATLNLSNGNVFACQKLSYNVNERAVVRSNGELINHESLSSKYTDLDRCLEGMGKFRDYKFGNMRNGASICNRDCCVCASGFTGKSCTEGCSPGYFGYNCQKRCDYCKGRTCNKINGTCESHCLEDYLPPDCKTQLKPPNVRCNETDVQFNYTDIVGEEREHVRFQIKKASGNSQWIELNITLEPTFSITHWPEGAIKILEPGVEYNVRAILNKTKSLEGIFNTKNWQFSEPQNVSLIPRNNGTVMLEWKQHLYLWEGAKTFDIYIDSLDSMIKENSGMKFINATTGNFTRKHDHHVELSLSDTMNYVFSIQPRDERHGKCPAYKVLYLLPEALGFANPEILKKNSTMEKISLTLAHLENATKENIVHVIMKRSPTCPSLKKNWNSTLNHSNMTNTKIKSTHGLETDGYPACRLRLNETYVFIVFVDDKTWQLHLIWLIIFPIAAIVWILYQKCKCGSMKSGLFSIRYDVSPRHRPISDSDASSSGNSVPPEVQRYKNFENYVRRAAENGILQQQFTLLPRGLVRSCQCGRLPENKPKNGYGNLIAYDETRVLLGRDSRGIYADYINANYIHGYCKEKAYIATQGPLSNTIVDFWRMIWQEEVRVICMLVDLVENGEEMCKQYWPPIGEEIVYGDIIILTMNQRVFADYTYRTFLLTRQGFESKKVVHLQYTGWPEKGVPMYSHSVIEYLQELLSQPPGQGPIVVHCSSGTGRTGAIILADIIRRRLAAEGTVDAFSEAKRMYSARANMLSNFGQYILAHLVPTQCLLMLPSKVPCSEITREKIEQLKNDIPKHITRLEESSWMDKSLRLLEPIKPLIPENVQKNRFPKLTPVGPSLVTLTRYPTYDNNSNYISAVSVDGMKIKKQYLASQLPMPSTLTDFWRLIVEKNVELIIVLQQPDPDDQTCCTVIPRCTTLIPLPHLKVENQTSLNSDGYFTMDKLLLTDKSQEPARSRIVTALTLNYWGTAEDARPPSPQTMMELWRASERIQRDGPTLVLCYDGVKGCGLYLALSLMLEEMAVEQELDVILAVRSIRRSRPDFVSAQWQFEYLYDVAMKYVESFQDYGNFADFRGSINQLYGL